jgi:hypothetical protein
VVGKRLEQPQRGGEITVLEGGDTGFQVIACRGLFDNFQLDGDAGFLLVERRGRFDDFRLGLKS